MKLFSIVLISLFFSQITLAQASQTAVADCTLTKNNQEAVVEQFETITLDLKVEEGYRGHDTVAPEFPSLSEYLNTVGIVHPSLESQITLDSDYPNKTFGYIKYKFLSSEQIENKPSSYYQYQILCTFK